jgi:hypothetical protein
MHCIPRQLPPHFSLHASKTILSTCHPAVLHAKTAITARNARCVCSYFTDGKAASSLLPPAKDATVWCMHEEAPKRRNQIWHHTTFCHEAPAGPAHMSCVHVHHHPTSRQAREPTVIEAPSPCSHHITGTIKGYINGDKRTSSRPLLQVRSQHAAKNVAGACRERDHSKITSRHACHMHAHVLQVPAKSCTSVHG